MDIISGEQIKVEDIFNRGANVVMVISTSWCGPCNAMVSIFDTLAVEFPNVNFVKVDVTDEVPSFINDLNVRAVPSIFFVRKGDFGLPMIGAKSIEQVRDLLTNWLQSEKSEKL